MGIFKSIDEKLSEIGFTKIEENEYGVKYRRTNRTYHYSQIVFIGRKESGEHLLQSYDKDLMDKNNTGNVCVGLTGYEMKLFLKKMKKIGLYCKGGASYK